MKTILFIEDNLAIRENVSEILELSGYHAIAASGGKEGLALIKEKLPDLILCDIMMPGLNGYDVLLHLKSSPTTSIIPFIFITASAEPAEMQTGLDMGANAYIRKPFAEDELLDAIAGCLNKS